MGADFINKVHYGDFLEKSRLLGRRKFDVVIADPPYNIGKDFGNDTDQRQLEDYLAWTDKWLSICRDHLSDNGLIYVYGFAEILAHVAVRHPLEKQRWLVWHYTNKTVPGRNSGKEATSQSSVYGKVKNQASPSI